MVYLEPWCKKDPRPCAKYIGTTDIIVSLIGVVIIICLPLLILSIEDEVIFILRTNPDTVLENNYLMKPQTNYTLVVTNTYALECHAVSLIYIRENLDSYFKNETMLNLTYQVTVNKTRILDENATMYDCETHIFCNRKPNTKLVNRGNRGEYSIIDAVVEAIMSLNRNQSEQEIINKMTVVESSADEIYFQHFNRESVSNVTNPGKFTCIFEHMSKISKPDIIHNYELVKQMFLITGALSCVTSILLIVTGYQYQNGFIISCIICELVCLSCIIAAIVLANKPSLCLLQYAGVSPAGRESPKYLQTVITYSCVAYLVLKLFILYFLVMFMRVAGKLPSIRLSVGSSVGGTSLGRVTPAEKEEVEKENRLKLIEALQKRQSNLEGMVSSGSEASHGVDKQK